MSSRLFIALTLFVIGGVTNAAVSDAIKLDLAAAKSAVTFQAIATPGSMKIRGEVLKDTKLNPITGVFDLQDKKLSGKAKIKLEALDTGISMRTKHMKEKYLQVDKFPEAELTINETSLPADALNGGTSKIPFKGTLLLHGQSKPIEGTLTASKKEGVLDLDFQFPVSLANFGIEQPAFMGIKVSDQVEVEAEVQSPVGVNG